MLAAAAVTDSTRQIASKLEYFFHFQHQINSQNLLWYFWLSLYLYSVNGFYAKL